MNKYGELSATAFKTIRLFDALKTKIIQDFAVKLCNAWGCEQECISFEFNTPRYFDKSKIIRWGFTLSIRITIPAYQPATFSLPGFSVYAIKDSEIVPDITIKYHDKTYKLDEPIDDFSDIIFQEIQKSIEQGSWV